MRMIDVLPEHIRDWIATQKASGLSASTIAGNKTILSAIFTTALNDQVVFLHPCAGVKTPTVARKPRIIVTPEQYDAIHHALPGTTTRLLVETAIESGLRWGELTELRAPDLDLHSRMLTVSRAVTETTAPADGTRFAVKAYPKGQGIPPPQTQRRRLHRAPRPHRDPQTRPHRPAVPARAPRRRHQPHDGRNDPGAHDDRRGGADRADRTQRPRTHLPARHPHRLHPRQMPLPPLQDRIRDLPRRPPRRRQRRPPRHPHRQHRRTHPPPLVPPPHLDPRHVSRATRSHGPLPRPTPRPRLLAARRRRRHPNRQRTTRPRQPAHHREIPPHPPRHRRHRPRRTPTHPRPLCLLTGRSSRERTNPGPGGDHGMASTTDPSASGGVAGLWGSKTPALTSVRPLVRRRGGTR